MAARSHSIRCCPIPARPWRMKYRRATRSPPDSPLPCRRNTRPAPMKQRELLLRFGPSSTACATLGKNFRDSKDSKDRSGRVSTVPHRSRGVIGGAFDFGSFIRYLNVIVAEANSSRHLRLCKETNLSTCFAAPPFCLQSAFTFHTMESVAESDGSASIYFLC